MTQTRIKPEIFTHYSKATLAFRMEDASPAPPPPDASAVSRMVQRVLRAWERNSPPALLLFGVGSGSLLAELARQLPSETSLCTSDSSPELVRAVLKQRPPELNTPQVHTLADTSPWAHKLLWHRAGLSPQNTLALINPELPASRRPEAQKLHKLFSTGTRYTLAATGQGRPSLSVGAILHPDEPGLDEFFARIPAWVKEVCCVWDAQDVPPALPKDPRRVDLARPLADGFAAQRNAMLSLCTGNWVLYLDADEALSRSLWEALPVLTSQEGINGWYFPRLTLFPDANHAKAGYGLWPDLQLRLFRNNPGVRFKRPVHERITGIAGRTAIAVNAPILHEQSLRKTNDDIRAKLARFDEAGQGRVRHHLSDDYPHLPLDFFPGGGGFTEPFDVITLD